jgi:hypothetical protein
MEKVAPSVFNDTQSKKQFLNWARRTGRFDNIKFTTYEKDRIDLTFEKDFTIWVAELKKRNNNHDDYFNEGFYIQKDKFDALMASEIKYKAYINLFKDDHMVIWNLTDLKDKLVFKERMMQESGENKTKVKKLVAYLTLPMCQHAFKFVDSYTQLK